MRRALNRVLSILILVSLLPVGVPRAYAETLELGSVCAGAPLLSVTFEDVGESGDSLRERRCVARVTAADGSFSQDIAYLSSRGEEGARLVDVNFDGYNDLWLLVAMGARNIFGAVALWNAETGGFDPVLTSCPWQRERFGEPRQLELCNEELLPQERMILSEVADGYQYSVLTAYQWESERFLTTRAVAEVYDAGEGRIGERMDTFFGTQHVCCWDMTYSEKWYYGNYGEDAGVLEERRAALRRLATGGLGGLPLARVSHPDWVHLRAQSGKDSASLAKLTHGTEVYALYECEGAAEGWVRVYLPPEDFLTEYGLTGYIWHSFLESAEAQR